MRRLVMMGGVALLTFGLAAPALAAAPGNDDIGNPTIVGALPYADGPHDTTEATTGATDPACFGAQADRSTVWYAFTPPSSERFLADTFGSDYDTTLYVGTANGSGGIDVIACNDDSVDVQAAVAWDAVGGQTYLVAVGTCCGGGVVGQAGGGGSLVFHVELAPPPPTIDLTVDPRGSFTKAGAAVIRGTIACANTVGSGGVSPADTTEGLIQVQASERVGRIVIHGFGAGFDGPCTEAPTTWSIEVPGDNGKFGGGAVQVAAQAQACGPSECTEADVSASVRLKH